MSVSVLLVTRAPSNRPAATDRALRTVEWPSSGWAGEFVGRVGPDRFL